MASWQFIAGAHGSRGSAPNPLTIGLLEYPSSPSSATRQELARSRPMWRLAGLALDRVERKVSDTLQRPGCSHDSRDLQPVSYAMACVTALESSPEVGFSCSSCGTSNYHRSQCPDECPAVRFARLMTGIGGYWVRAQLADAALEQLGKWQPLWTDAELDEIAVHPRMLSRTLAFGPLPPPSSYVHGPPSVQAGSYLMCRLVEQIQVAPASGSLAQNSEVRRAALALAVWTARVVRYLLELFPQWESASPGTVGVIDELACFAAMFEEAVGQGHGWLVALDSWHAAPWVFVWALQALWESTWLPVPPSLGIGNALYAVLRDQTLPTWSRLSRFDNPAIAYPSAGRLSLPLAPVRRRLLKKKIGECEYAPFGHETPTEKELGQMVFPVPTARGGMRNHFPIVRDDYEDPGTLVTSIVATTVLGPPPDSMDDTDSEQGIEAVRTSGWEVQAGSRQGGDESGHVYLSSGPDAARLAGHASGSTE
jgi:hypothetical protein